LGDVCAGIFCSTVRLCPSLPRIALNCVVFSCSRRQRHPWSLLHRQRGCVAALHPRPARPLKRCAWQRGPRCQSASLRPSTTTTATRRSWTLRTWPPVSFLRELPARSEKTICRCLRRPRRSRLPPSQRARPSQRQTRLLPSRRPSPNQQLRQWLHRRRSAVHLRRRGVPARRRLSRALPTTRKPAAVRASASEAGRASACSCAHAFLPPLPSRRDGAADS
jgi:hypothetical protein